ncbi:hypothetical protein ARTHRO9AX_220103 [Arthrobacter sp. 9AX]|nr:hypothetical protein ARTHRO9AX_220103 [Arthrobacter sp. 9AX]
MSDAGGAGTDSELLPNEVGLYESDDAFYPDVRTCGSFCESDIYSFYATVVFVVVYSFFKSC